MKNLTYFLLLFLIPFLRTSAKTDDGWLIEKKDRSVIIGDSLHISNDSVFINVHDSLISMPRTKILKMENIEDDKAYINNRNPNYPTYLFNNNAIPVPKGEHNFRNVYISINQIQLSPTNSLLIEGGLELINSVFGEPYSYLALSNSYKISENVYASAGLSYINHSYLSIAKKSEHVAMFKVSGTYGNTENNVTASGGLAYNSSGEELINIYSLCASFKIYRKISFVTDNNILFYSGDYMSLLSAGLRFIYPGVAIDLGIIKLPVFYEYNGSTLKALPYLTLTFNL
jgi:hypothetical protein